MPPATGFQWPRLAESRRSLTLFNGDFGPKLVVRVLDFGVEAKVSNRPKAAIADIRTEPRLLLISGRFGEKSCCRSFLQTLHGAPRVGIGGTSLASLTTDRAGFDRTGTV